MSITPHFTSTAHRPRSAPLLGPSLGPILGGVLTQGFDWRATFWLLAIIVGICFLLFIPFKDTFRRERSLTYQAALKKRRAHISAKASEASSISQVTAVSRIVSPTAAGKAQEENKDAIEELARDRDLEKQQQPPRTAEPGPDAAPMDDVKLSLADVNPVKPIIHVLRRMNNLVILVASGKLPRTRLELLTIDGRKGLTFGFSYCISYTCSRTLANQYGYDALKIGLVLLAFGVGEKLGRLGARRCTEFCCRLSCRERPRRAVLGLCL